MPLQVRLICLLDFIFLFLLPPATTFGITRKPDCLSRCGDVSIPYPFGVGSDCSLNESFNIICDTSAVPHKPYLNISDYNLSVEVVEVGVSNPPQIRIKYPQLLSGVCYDNTTGNKTWEIITGIFLKGTQYTVSDENWLIAIGCDDLLRALMPLGDGQDLVRESCWGNCAEEYKYYSVNGSCPNNEEENSNNGCCRIAIPKGSTSVYAYLISVSKAWISTRIYPCSYAYITEKMVLNKIGFWYNTSLQKENVTAVMPGNPTVVRLDWRIGTENCSLARRNSSTFACQDNITTECVDFGHNVQGYLCNCSQGYVGNPYLYQGCKDINECDENPCGPNSICINTPGSYNCLCRRGYTGDGKSLDKGCTRSLPLSTTMVVLIGLASMLGFLLLLLVWYWLNKVLQKRKNRKRKEDLFKHLLFLHRTNEETFGNTKLFTAKELEKATDCFNESHICGQGGQGMVYRGMLSDGTIVAIKKLKHVDENQVEQFINEVVILSQINHKNVVKLLGCCLATEVPLLVYEFLPNGTLSDLIRDPNLEFPFTWNMRLKIATDIAGAVAYLHFASTPPIYHRDIKSSNFLLDKKYVVKVADFGISKFVEEDQTHLTTKQVKGTFGYFDPEYFQSRQYTEKSDVYSFGVVLAELLTGKKPIFQENPEEALAIDLATYFRTTMKENSLNDILDPQVSEIDKKEEVIAVARLAERCLNQERKNRPTMKDVSAELETIRISQMPATVNEESEDSTVNEDSEDATEYESNHIMISDTQYSWTSSAVRGTSPTSSEINPLMFETV